MAASHSLPEKKYLNRIYQQISPFIRVTPLIELESLSQWIQGRVLVKAESLQKTGAFKFRGALHRLANLSENEKNKELPPTFPVVLPQDWRPLAYN